jgi:hypothetical protein
MNIVNNIDHKVYYRLFNREDTLKSVAAYWDWVDVGKTATYSPSPNSDGFYVVRFCDPNAVTEPELAAGCLNATGTITLTSVNGSYWATTSNGA